MAIEKKKLLALLSTIIVASTVLRARADEEMRPLAISGDWVAMAHSSSSISAPDMCLVASVTKKAIIRADADGVEFRVSNKDWSLPSDVKGKVNIAINNREIDLEISSNTDDW